MVEGSRQALESLPGVGEATAQKLREAGYQTIESIAVVTVAGLYEAAEDSPSGKCLISALTSSAPSRLAT